MDTFIQSHLHDYHSCTSPSISTAGYLLEESRLIAFAQGQRVSRVWGSNLLVTSPFSQSNRSYGCLKSSAQRSPSPLKWPCYYCAPANTVMGTSLSVCLPSSSEDALNNTTSLMDWKVGWSFTKGQHVSEIQETTFGERREPRVMPNVYGPVCGVGVHSIL